MSEGQYKGHLGKMLQDTEAALADIIGGRESVVFLAPMGAHNAIAVEAWQAVEQWDLQTKDGTVYAVRYGVPEGDPEHSQTLANLKSRITTAATTDKFAGKRIANVSGLNTYYRDIGAYGDITPGDGKSDTFTPAQPPAKLTCANGTAVASPNANRGLVHDCEALLAAKDTLRGTASLNWSASTAITGWAGVTVSGTPKRVTQVRLSNKGLSGTLPAALGELSALTALDLSRNSLTGSIPAELGLLRTTDRTAAEREHPDGLHTGGAEGRHDERPRVAEPAVLRAARAGEPERGTGDGDIGPADVGRGVQREQVPGGARVLP